VSADRHRRSRANGEGSIYPYRNGSWAGYVWVTTPDGARKRAYAYGQSREEVHAKWLKLHSAAKSGPVVTRSQTVGEYFAYWLKEVVIEPDYAPQTVSIYEIFSRLYIIPALGNLRLDRLSVRQVRTWLAELRSTCQCCAQGKDAERKPEKRRCCAVGKCCESRLSEYTVQAVLRAFRSALSRAFEVNRDRVSVRLLNVSSWELRCVTGAGSRGCRRCGPGGAGSRGCGTRRPGGPRAWRAGSGSRRWRW
jgi:hypothetical protein